MYVLIRMDCHRGSRWVENWKSFSRQWVWSVYGHPHGHWWCRSRGIADALRGLRPLRWNGHYGAGCNGWRSACDDARRLCERQKGLCPSILRVLPHRTRGFGLNSGTAVRMSGCVGLAPAKDFVQAMPVVAANREVATVQHVALISSS